MSEKRKTGTAWMGSALGTDGLQASTATAAEQPTGKKFFTARLSDDDGLGGSVATDKPETPGGPKQEAIFRRKTGPTGPQRPQKRQGFVIDTEALRAKAKAAGVENLFVSAFGSVR